MRLENGYFFHRLIQVSAPFVRKQCWLSRAESNVNKQTRLVKFAHFASQSRNIPFSCTIYNQEVIKGPVLNFGIFLMTLLSHINWYTPCITISTSHFLLLANNNTSISFIWVPSHMDIPRSEEVDKAAKDASSLHCVRPQLLPYKIDRTLFIRHLIITHWYDHWRHQYPNNTWLESNRTQ